MPENQAGQSHSAAHRVFDRRANGRRTEIHFCGPRSVTAPFRVPLSHVWHRWILAPFHAVRDSVRDGGPGQRRKTEHGRREMETAAHTLPRPTDVTGPAVELHLLSGARFWYQTVFCLWTFSRQAGRPVAPVVYDDGTLSLECREPIQRLFPRTQFVTTAETLARLDEYLPTTRFPVLRERWAAYPNLRKLTDVHAGQRGPRLVLDSDLLFFRRPTFMLDWLDDPQRPLHAVDCETSYGYSRNLMSRLAGHSIAERVNVGLTGLSGETIDWEKLEWWCRRLIDEEQHSYFLEQAIVAMLVAGRKCAVAPANEYITLPTPPEALECRAVMHHYVSYSKRWYFQHNWRRVLEAAFGN